MKCAEKICVCLISVLFAVSCGLDQMGESLHSNPDGVWKGPSFGKYGKDKCYAVALDYPEGYNWRADPEKGNVRCTMVLFADGVPVLKVPVGDRYRVSSEPGCHKVLEGHLYTFHADSSSTVVKKDGSVLQAWAGAEMIEDIRIVGESVHTLSRPSDGKGFVYRVDGGVMVQRETGSSFGRMDVHDGHVYFYFSQSISSSDGMRFFCYRVVDGKVHRIDTPAGFHVTDIRMLDQEVMTSLAGGQPGIPLMIWPDHHDTLMMHMRVKAVSLSLLEGDIPVACARHMYSGSELMTDILWEGGRTWKIYRSGSTLSDVYADDSGYGAVVNPAGSREGNIFSGDKAYLIPSGYSVYSRGCIVRKKGLIHVGLTSSEGGCPLVWKEGILDTLKVNGPLTCLR